MTETENLRIITANDPDGSNLYGIRSDAEAHHTEFKQTRRNTRAMGLGGRRGLIDQYMFALSHDAIAVSRLRRGGAVAPGNHLRGL